MRNGVTPGGLPEEAMLLENLGEDPWRVNDSVQFESSNPHCGGCIPDARSGNTAL
jgi:hypothetical protein